MSANNAIFINKKNFKVYHHGCMDNKFKPTKNKLIGQGKSLEEAIEIAEEFKKECLVEYGSNFF